MQIEQRSAGWYLSVDGGTDGGDPVGGECLGPFPRRPELLRKSEGASAGPSGERLLTVIHTLLAGEHVVTVREQFWQTPTDGTRVKLLEVFDGSSSARTFRSAQRRRNGRAAVLSHVV